MKILETQAEILRPEEFAENIIAAIEAARAKVLKKIKRKRRKLVKFVEGVGEDFEDLVQKWSAAIIKVTLVTGIFLTTALPVTAASIPKFEITHTSITPTEKENLRQKILEYLANFGENRKVNAQMLSDLVSQITGLPTRAVLAGNKIPTVFGAIATEQHLMIYPGESLSEHLAGEDSFQKYSWTGMSTTAGAWGYFTDNKNTVTEEQRLQEKYYLVIQTFAAENWNQIWPHLKEWYKFRKLLVYNPENGKGVVGALADAGPAQYTGRAFGGSPEVMETLGLAKTSTQGDVLVFFVDDPNNTIPLGPVSQETILAGLSVEGR